MVDLSAPPPVTDAELVHELREAATRGIHVRTDYLTGHPSYKTLTLAARAANTIDRLTARLDAERWQPIETAPHTETIIGYYAPTRGMIMAHWFPAEGGTEAGFFTEEECQGPCNLTHWRPLPPPPDEANG